MNFRPGGCLGVGFDQGLGNDHEQRGGYALSGHVRHHHGQVVIVNGEEVVEVTAHLFGGVHGGVEIVFPSLGGSGEDTRQHILLDFRRHVQFRADALLFRGDGQQVLHEALHVAGHGGQRVGQGLQFVAGVNAGVREHQRFRILLPPAALHETLGGAFQLRHGRNDPAVQPAV